MALLEETLFGSHDKVAIALQRLRTFEPPEGYYLAFSGGKDTSMLLKRCLPSARITASHTISGVLEKM